MHDFKGIPWQHFREFISPTADRFTVLKAILDETGLAYTVLPLAGNRHFIVAPPPPQEEYLRRPPVALTAHYDRADGSPGANDNSAGVFLLIETALKLKANGVKNWLMFFTDKEELKTGESIQAQGSYSLAVNLKSTILENAKIFCFDACGAGDTLIISTTVDNLLERETGGDRLQESLAELRSLSLETARNLGMKKVLLAPTPFSDDVGFFRAGLAAQTITMLPSQECIDFISEVRRNKKFANALINAELRNSSRTQFIPETWRSLNTARDSHLRLTPRHFRTVIRFAEALCKG